MEAPQSLFWSIPSEIIVSIFSLLPFRSIINFETADKTQSKQFNERDLYKQLACNLFHWGPNDVKSAEQFSAEKINWRAEFIISSIHHNKILTNELQYEVLSDDTEATKLIEAVTPNHYRYIQPVSPRAPHTDLFVFQSKFPLYPHPLADFTVAYYETSLIAKRSLSEVVDNFCIGAALYGYVGVAGMGRNSFAYGDKGQILMEFNFAPSDHPAFNAGDTVGFGIDFHSRAVFWTLNGQLVCSRTHNYWHEPLLNLDTLHAVVSCHQGFEFSINFGTSPFMFDILKFQRRRDDESKANKKTSDPMFDFSTPVNKQTYSITMLYSLLKHIEEDTIHAIERGAMSPWVVGEMNPPPAETKVDVPPLWVTMTYPNNDFAHLRMFEIYSMRGDLLKEWKHDKGFQSLLKRVAIDANIPFNEAIDTYEDLLDKLQSQASIFLAMTIEQMLDKHDEQIRDNFGLDVNIAPGWTQVAKAYKFIISTDLPFEHFLVQAALHFLSCIFEFPDCSLPIKQDMVPELIACSHSFLMSLRLVAIKLFILDKNEQKKEEFEKRNAWLKDLYQQRLSQELIELIISNSNVPEAPKPTDAKERELITSSLLESNLIRLEHYDKLSDESRTNVLIEVMGLTHISAYQLESEEKFIEVANKQIRQKVGKEKFVEQLENLKKGLQLGQHGIDALEGYDRLKDLTANVNGVVEIAKMFGLDVTVPHDKLIEQVMLSIDETIDKETKPQKENKKKNKKSKTQEQSSMTTQLLLGAGLGLLIGLGAAFIAHRYRSK